MATKFTKNLGKISNGILVGYSGYVHLVLDGDAVHANLTLTEDTNKPGVYYRYAVPRGSYKIYVDLDKDGTPVEGDLYRDSDDVAYTFSHIDEKMIGIAQYADDGDSFKLVTAGLQDASVTETKIASEAVYPINTQGAISRRRREANLNHKTMAHHQQLESAPLTNYNYGKFSTSGTWEALAWVTQIKAAENRIVDEFGIFVVGDFESNPSTEFDGDLLVKAWVNGVPIHTETIDNSVLLTKVPFTTMQNAEIVIVPSAPIYLNVGDTLTVAFQHTGTLKIALVYKSGSVDPTLDWGENKHLKSDVVGYVTGLTAPPALSSKTEAVPIHCYSYVTDFVQKMDSIGRPNTHNIIDRLVRFDLEEEKVITGVPLNGATMVGSKITVPVGQTGASSYIYINYNTSLYDRYLNYYNKTLVFEFLVKIKNGTLIPQQMLCTLTSVGSGQVASQGGSQTYEYLETYVADTELSYRARVELPITYNDITNINTYLQLTSAPAVGLEATIEVTEAITYVKGEAYDTVLNSSTETLKQLLYEAQVKGAANAINPDFSNPKISDYGTVTVIPGGGGDYTDIQSAIDAIYQLASETNQYAVIIHPGTYEATTLAEYTVNPYSGTMYDFITMRPYVHLIGVDKKRCRIYSTLSGGEATLANTSNHQTIGFYRSGMLMNLTVECYNNRYPVHQDAGRTGLTNGLVVTKNCHIEHLGGDGGTWTSRHAWGCGLSDGQISIHKGTTFKSTTEAFFFHTNEAFTNPTYTLLENCKCISENSAISIQAQGTGKNDILELNGNTIVGYINYSNGSAWLPTALADQSVYRSEVKIKGSGNTPSLFRNTAQGVALKVISNTVGAGSTVAVSGDAKTLIYGTGETYAGVDVLKGFALGDLDIGEDGVGAAANVYIKSLGKRLGDCSSVNKTLTLTFDGGVPIDVVFNTDLTNETNVTIIGLIDTAISGSGDSTTYTRGREYFAEFEEVHEYQNTSATLVILKGMGVKRAGLYKIDKLTNSDSADEFLGIALEDIRPSSWGKVLTKGMMYDSNAYMHHFLQSTYNAAALGTVYGIDPSNAGKFLKDASPTLLTGVASNRARFN